MENNTQLYIIPKPESAKYLQDIEDILTRNNFLLKGTYAINDWEDLARKTYTTQLDEGSLDFRMAFEGHIRVTKILFGNESVLMLLANPYQSLLEGLEKLFQRKKKIREELGKKGHDNLLICANLEGFPKDVFSEYGRFGTLGVGDQQGFHPFSGYDGIWDYFYFKFVHIADPKIDILNREWRVLLDLGILNNDIPKERWELMKYLGTLKSPK